MDPLAAQFFEEALPQGAEIAATAAGMGAALGFVLAVVVAFVQHRLGWLRWPGKRTRVVLVLCLLWIVGGTVAAGASAGGGIGLYVGLSSAIKDSAFGRDVLPRLAASGADGVAAAVLATEDLTGAALTDVAGDVDAFRDGTWAIPVAAPQAALGAYATSLRGPDGQAVEDGLVDVVGGAMPMGTRTGVRSRLRPLLADARAGGDPSVTYPSLRNAWAQIPVAAATDADPLTLSREELTTLLVDKVLLPEALRPVMIRVVPGVLIALFGLLPAWLVPALVTGWFRRRG